MLQDVPKTNTAKEDAYCTKKVVKKDKGDQCEADTECKSGMCTEGKCSTLPDGAECKKHYQYGQFSACRSSDSTCQPLLKEGEQCDSDYECDFNLACGDGKCQKMFSLEVGEVTTGSYAKVELVTNTNLKRDITSTV